MTYAFAVICYAWRDNIYYDTFLTGTKTAQELDCVVIGWLPLSVKPPPHRPVTKRKHQSNLTFCHSQP